MTKQELINRIIANFPQSLRDLDQWVVWRIEERDGKPTKVPYAITGYRAESDNPLSWASFDNACHSFLSGDYAGVGFVFSEHDPYAGVDFDKCVNDGEMDPQREYWMQGLGSYSEYSQSGTGAHTIVQGKLPTGGRKSRRHNVEMYDSLRFFVVTGDRIHGTPTGVNKRQAELEALHAEIFPAQKRPGNVITNEPVDVDAIPADDRELLRRMFAARNGASVEALWNGNMSAYNDDESAADLALCNHLAFYTGRDADRMDRLFRQSGLYRQKWERSARVGETYGAGTIARAIAGTAKTYTGHRNGNGYADEHGSVLAGPTDDREPAPTKTSTEEEGAPEIDVLKYRAEDGGLLDAWVEHYGDHWIYATGSDRWHYWNGACWQVDDCLTIQREIRDLLDTINRRCSQHIKEAPDRISKLVKSFAGIDMPDSAAKQIESLKAGMEIAEAMRKASKRTNGRIASIEGMAKSVNAKPVSAFDICDSINLSNGTLNLHSLEMQPHNREDLFTYQLGYEYDPEATCPLFEKFIGEVLVKEGTTETDQELVDLFQELLGYSLTTQTKRQVMIWMYGDGGNGKSVAVDIVQAMLGPMATTVDFQSIGLPGNYDLADIPGKRVIFSTEAEKGGAVSEKHIKCIVSGDPLTARPIYGSPVKFHSTAKIWWAMNDRPVIKDTSDSMWRRMKLIPFLRKFEEGKNADVDLPQKLKAERPGILNWAIRGLIRLTLNDRFTYSEAAESAKSQYREESNPVARWVNTMTVRTDYPSTLQGALFDSFKSWLSSENEKAITSNQFGRDLGRLKIPKTRRDKGYMYHLALIQS